MARAADVRVGGLGRGDAGLAEGVHGALALDVEDGGERDAGHPEQLGGEAAAHLPCADEADAQRAAGLVESLLEPVAIAHVFCSLV